MKEALPELFFAFVGQLLSNSLCSVAKLLEERPSGMAKECWFMGIFSLHTSRVYVIHSVQFNNNFIVPI